LASYDGEGAAEAIVALAEAIHRANAALVSGFLSSEATTLYEHGRDRGSNVHLTALIVLRRKLLALAGVDLFCQRNTLRAVEVQEISRS
jgi:hypothetical protein